VYWRIINATSEDVTVSLHNFRQVRCPGDVAVAVHPLEGDSDPQVRVRRGKRTYLAASAKDDLPAAGQLCFKYDIRAGNHFLDPEIIIVH
jgi:hypothetical protein